MSHTTDISNLIVLKLQGCPTIKTVYNYEPTLLAGWPTAVVTIKNGEGEFADNRRSKRTHYFLIKVYVDVDPVTTNFKNSDAERITLLCLDEITNAFDSDITLGGGTVIYCRPIDYNAEYVIRENAARVLQLTLECVEVV